MPDRPLPDAAARARIERELDRNLLVEAGAGSGKTESLARRMAAGIAAGAYTVDRMAAVTFTRKAAAELRGRFQVVLERRLREEADPERRARVEQALGRLEQLFAGTIHAFCAHLLRERPVEAGVAPGFVELDDLADATRRRAAWRQHCEAERARGTGRFAALAEVGLAPADLDAAFDLVCRFPEVAFPAGATRAPDAAPAARALRAFWAALQPRLPAPMPPDATCPVLARAVELGARLPVADLERPPELAALLDRWAAPRAPIAKWWGGADAARPARALVDRFARDTAGPFVAAWRRHVYRVAVEFLQGAREAAADARRRALALNYEDLLQVAARLLRTRADVRAALQARYRWLFVDEFQDTDPIQAEVILLLAAAGGAPGVALDWRRVPLRPGALFVVGDPKQSIYRFRRADIQTYAAVRARIEATGGAVVPLTTSFRARPVLCDWANDVFPRFFPRRATAEQPAFDRLDPVRDAGEARRTGVRQLVVAASIERRRVREADAAAIAGWIRAEVAAGRRTFGDHLVLTCRRGSLDAYARALEALGVPVEVSGASGFAASPAVRVLADLLRALADPDDQPAVVGVLRGRLFGLSDAALFRHRQAGLPLGLAVPLPPDAAGPVADALRQLRELARWTRRLPPAAALGRVLEATGWLADAVAGSAGGAEGGHLLHAVDRVRQVAEDGGTLADAARALEGDLESTEVESQPLEPGRRDVVRVMNLHRAKGLEGPVVFLADPLGGLADQVDVRIVRDGARAEGYFPLVRYRERDWGWQREVLGEPAGWADHEAAERRFLDAERRRLLYVAATRARDLLVVSRWAGAGGGSRPWEAFAPFLDAAPRLRVPALALDSSPAPGDSGADDAPAAAVVSPAPGGAGADLGLAAAAVSPASPPGLPPAPGAAAGRDPAALRPRAGVPVAAAGPGGVASVAAAVASRSTDAAASTGSAPVAAGDREGGPGAPASPPLPPPAGAVSASAPPASSGADRAAAIPASAEAPREPAWSGATRDPDDQAWLAAREAAAAARAARDDAARRPSWRVESVTGTAHKAAAPGEPVQRGRTREPDTGMAWGTLVHGLLEHAARLGRFDRVELERVGRWLALDSAELRRVLPEALDTVAGVMASELWQRARAAEELHPEVPFAVRLVGEGEGDDATPRVLHGVIDLAFRTAAGWELVDYKTDQADLATLAGRYGDQVRQYAAQWAALTGEPVGYAGIHGVREQGSSPDLQEGTA